MLALYPPTAISEGYTLEDVDENYALTDGERFMTIHYVQGLNVHAEGMLMAFLPKEKILIEADMFDSPAPGEKPAEAGAPARRALLNNVKQIGLDVKTIAPIHGRAVAWSEFLKAVQ
jgi:hypothetical protein